MEHIKKNPYKFWQICAVIMLYTLIFAVSVFADNSKHEKGYTYNLDKLSQKAEKKIKQVNIKLEKRKKEELNKKRELEARKYFEEGNRLSEEGKDEQAKEAWQKALKIAKDPAMKKDVKDSD